MTITISCADYDALWQQANPQLQDMGHSAFSDIRRIVPNRLGEGYIQSMQWAGIDLTLFHYRFHEDVRIRHRAKARDSQAGEIGFHLSGNRHGKCTGDNFIEWGHYDDPDSWEQVTYANETILKVDIHLDSSSSLSQLIADTLNDLPKQIYQCLEDFDGNWLSEVNTITPAMRLSLEQIFHCPFKGKTKQIYLESKCLELVALKLEQLKENNKHTGPFCSLKPEDVERIYLAQSILTNNLDDPPSLMELARQVSLNDYKLKIGFRQVFGTTVFGYLYQYRMDTARQLLAKQQMNVKEVARTIGYASQSRFATAFRKQFGMNPKAYLLSKKSE